MAGRCPECGSKALHSRLVTKIIREPYKAAKIETVRIYECIRCGWKGEWSRTK